jgi:CHASE3 domain sensor protein
MCELLDTGRGADYRSTPMGRWREAGLLRRVEALALLVVLVVIAVLGIAITAATDARHSIDRRGNRLGPANTAAVALLADFTDEETGVRGYIVTEDPSYLSPYRSAEGRLPDRFRTVASLLESEPQLWPQLDHVRIDHDAWVRTIAEPEIAAAAAGDFGRAADIERSGQGRVRFDILREDLDTLQSGIAAARDRESRRISGAQDVLLATLIGAVLLVLLLTAAVTLAVSRLLIRPFNRVRAAVDAVADGDLDTAVPSTGPSEVADLGARVETMRSRLVASLEESRRAVEALTQQGPAVIALRDALAPSRTASQQLSVVGRLEAAEGVLAGDWYDALDLPNGRVGLIVGDVSGHGPGPGVFALRLKHLLAAALATGMTPGMSVEWVVAQLGDTGEMFATALVLVIDPASGRIEYTNAGHPEAALLRGRGDRLERLGATGPLLSRVVAAPGVWTTRSTTLDEGDVLLAYTDGLVEARRADGTELGAAGLFEHLRAVTDGAPGLEPDQLLEAAFEFVRRQAAGPASDDRTVVAVARGIASGETAIGTGVTGQFRSAERRTPAG